MTFPIYRVSLEHSDPTKTHHFHNKMFRDEKHAEIYFANNEQEYRSNLAVYARSEDFRFMWALSHRETWCLEWFSHYTFRDRFTSPGEVIADFEEYVSRIERRQGFYEASPDRIKRFEALTDHKWICLMGAEERYRWSGAGDTPAPCSCKACVAQAVWRINH